MTRKKRPEERIRKQKPMVLGQCFTTTTDRDLYYDDAMAAIRAEVRARAAIVAQRGLGDYEVDNALTLMAGQFLLGINDDILLERAKTLLGWLIWRLEKTPSTSKILLRTFDQ